MPFNIEEFRSQVAHGNGLLKGNRFIVRMNVPKILSGKNVGRLPISTIETRKNRGAVLPQYNVGGDLTSKAANDMMEFHAEKINMPGIALQTSDMRRFGVGNIEKTAWGVILPDLDVTFTIDQNTHVWNFYREWMNSIYKFDISNGTEFEMNYKNDYITNISIFVYAESRPQKHVMRINYWDAYPVSMSDLPLDWGVEELLRLNIKFNYLSWNISDGMED